MQNPPKTNEHVPWFPPVRANMSGAHSSGQNSRQAAGFSAIAEPDRIPPAVTPAVAGLPSITLDGDDNPRGAYLDSCRDLQNAIGSLESALVAFTGKEEGVKGQVFAKTRARLDRELS